jgi:NAD(P)H-hydrate epimerase
MLRLTREQLREIDRRSVEEYHIPSIVLMENAARSAVEVALSMRDPAKQESPITVVCGSGNNGGDGLAIARHLHNRGAEVLVVMTVSAEKLSGDALTNWKIVQAMGITWWASEIPHWPLDGPIVDAILGTGLTEAPRAAAARAIRRINAAKKPVLAIDLPSGMDANTGEAFDPTVKATKTITFVAEKSGFANPGAAEFLGEVMVGDIGCPRKLIENLAAGGQHSAAT